MSREYFRSTLVEILGERGATCGTGFVVSTGGLILTCAHVVRDAGSGPGMPLDLRFLVHGPDSRVPALVEEAPFLDTEDGDLALVRLTHGLPEDCNVAAFGPSLETGELLGYGFPAGVHGREQPTLAQVVSPEGGYVEDTRYLLVRSNEINPGFSGGPLFDQASGRVVGMIQEIMLPDAETGRNQQTAYALPTETLGARLCRRATRIRKPDVDALVEEISLNVRPRCAWPHSDTAGDTLDPTTEAALAEALAKSRVLDHLPPWSVLFRLPQDIASRTLDGAVCSTREEWALALIRSCATRLDTLPLLAAVMLELAPLASASKEFDARVKEELYRGFSECDLQALRFKAWPRGKKLPEPEELRQRVHQHARGARLGANALLAPEDHLTWALRLLADLPPQNGTAPVEAFCLDSGSPALVTARGVSSESEHPVLFVVVAPLNGGGYGAEIWGVAGAAFANKLYESAGKAVLLDDLRRYVSDARDVLLQETGAMASQLRVEFVLPRELLCEGVEHWPVKMGLRLHPVGDVCRVIVRSWERLYLDYASISAEWRGKWRAYFDEPALLSVAPFARVEHEGVFSQLLEARAVVLTSPPPPTPEDLECDPIQLCVDAAIPIVVWFREQSVSHPTLTGTASPPPDYYRQLPEWAKLTRRAAIRAPKHEPHAGRSLTLLWDNPEQKPPRNTRKSLGKRHVE
jgi:hypothetical protein